MVRQPLPHLPHVHTDGAAASDYWEGWDEEARCCLVPPRGWVHWRPRWSQTVTPSCLEDLLQSWEKSEWLRRLKGESFSKKNPKKEELKTEMRTRCGSSVPCASENCWDLGLHLLSRETTSGFSQTEEKILSLRSALSPPAAGAPARGLWPAIVTETYQISARVAPLFRMLHINFSLSLWREQLPTRW